MGVERSRVAAQNADLILFTIDATAGWTEADQEIYEQVKHRPLILVINKIDLISSLPTLSYPPLPSIQTAAALNQGIDQLEQAILETVQAGILQAANLDLAINQRQAEALTRAKNSLQQVQTTIANQLPLDFWTIDLRAAIQALPPHFRRRRDRLRPGQNL
jgi:tRNA modification GTPase trmE